MYPIRHLSARRASVQILLAHKARGPSGPLRFSLGYGAIPMEIDVVVESPLADVAENWHTSVPAILVAVGITTVPEGAMTVPEALNGPVHEYVADGA